jgi:hypothetical protein
MIRHGYSLIESSGLQKPSTWVKTDSWRKSGDLFNGEVELRAAPRKGSGIEIRMLMNDWEDCPMQGKKKKEPKLYLVIWKRKSVFWDLPYWHILDTPHSLDLMHIKKNVCEILLGTLLNMPEKTKDGPKARQDLIDLQIRADLHVPPWPGSAIE